MQLVSQRFRKLLRDDVTIPFGNVEFILSEYPGPFACSQRVRLSSAFMVIWVARVLGFLPDVFSNTTPRFVLVLRASSTWATSKALLLCKIGVNCRMPGNTRLPETIT